MRITKVLMLIVLAGTLAWSESSASPLDATSADGWHSWQVDAGDGRQAQFYVLVEGGKPVRIHSHNCSCQAPTRAAIDDHGAVSASQSYAWFRAVVEDSAVEERIRDAALFGLVESGTDDAFEYIDQILSQR